MNTEITDLKLKTVLFMLCFAVLLFTAAGCDNNDNDVYTPKTYEVQADYIGKNYKASENVKGVSVYDDIAAYKAAETIGDSLWIEESEASPELIASAIQSKKTIIIIADESTDADMLTGRLTDLSIKEKPDGELVFLGVLLTDITGNGYDAAALYYDGTAEVKTDFWAFCSEYKYNERYQGDTLETDILADAKVIKNCFSIIDFSEQAYAVTFATLVDYGDNPTGGTSLYKYEYTLMSYADVVCVKGRSAGFNSVIYAGGDGETIKCCPENGTDFEAASSIDMNFLFKRYFASSFDMDYRGSVKSLVKGRDSFMEWRICSTDKKGNEVLNYKPKNFTGAVDCKNTDGVYTPTFELSFSTENDTGTAQWSFKISMNEISVRAE